jgi:very-short-patch-repair endonuclease
MAAVLAGGAGAALGYASGAAFWDLRRGVPAVIDVVVATAGGRARPGLRMRRTLAAYEAGATNTRSDLEKAFLTLCEHYGLPRPRVNVPLCDMTVDFVFVDRRVAVETDSWRWHRGRAAFERDRDRDALLAAAGYTTLRFTDPRSSSRRTVWREPWRARSRVVEPRKSP